MSIYERRLEDHKFELALLPRYWVNTGATAEDVGKVFLCLTTSVCTKEYLPSLEPFKLWIKDQGNAYTNDPIAPLDWED